MKRIFELSPLVMLCLAGACTEPNPASDGCGPLGCAHDGDSSGTAGVSQDDDDEGRGGTSGPGGEGAGEGTDGGATAGSASAGSTDGGSSPGSGTDGSATEGNATDATEGEAETPPGCGDGAMDDGEACDDGELNGSYGHCNAECSGLAGHCGDGEVQVEEECDDGNEAWDDGCDPDCVRSVVDVESGFSHNCVILRSREVKCWGRGRNGRLGYGNPDNDIGDDEAPASVDTLPLGGPVQQLALGVSHTCALLMDGSVKCWGYGHFGELGYGDSNTIGDQEGELAQQGFVSVDARRAVVQLTAGSSHTCARLEGGAVKCWGYNGSGQLGLGDRAPSSTAATVPSALLDVVSSGVEEVQAGNEHTCTRAGSGVVRCWGWNLFGQLGNGQSGQGTEVWSSPDAAIPAVNGQGSLVPEVLALGAEHTCAARGTSACNGLAPAARSSHKYGPARSRNPPPAPIATAITRRTLLCRRGGLLECTRGRRPHKLGGLGNA